MKGYSIFYKFSGHPEKTLWYSHHPQSLAAYYSNLFWIHQLVTARLVLLVLL